MEKSPFVEKVRKFLFVFKYFFLIWLFQRDELLLSAFFAWDADLQTRHGISFLSDSETCETWIK